MVKDKLLESYAQIYDWTIKDDKVVPPYVKHPLPEFVYERIRWVVNEINNGLMYVGGMNELIDIDDEKDLREKWELGASSDYLPVTKEYREWLEDPLYENPRKAAVIVAFLYWNDDKEALINANA